MLCGYLHSRATLRQTQVTYYREAARASAGRHYSLSALIGPRKRLQESACRWIRIHSIIKQWHTNTRTDSEEISFRMRILLILSTSTHALYSYLFISDDLGRLQQVSEMDFKGDPLSQAGKEDQQVLFTRLIEHAVDYVDLHIYFVFFGKNTMRLSCLPIPLENVCLVRSSKPNNVHS